MSKKKRSNQSQPDKQESLQTEQASNSSDAVNQKTKILELKGASSSQREQVPNSSDAVDQKTEIIELKSPSSSQRESQAENQQVTNNTLTPPVTDNVNSTINNQQTNDNSTTFVTDNVKPIANNQEADKASKPKPAIKLKKPQKKEFSPPPYKNLETATNQNGEIFAVGEKIKINTCNFGEYTVEIKFLYETADGSIWATYFPVGDASGDANRAYPRSTTAGEEGQKHPWRLGCQRLELLEKSNFQENLTSNKDATSKNVVDSVSDGESRE